MATERTSGREIFHLNAKLGIVRFVKGVNYWRYAEYPWVYNNLGLSENQRILDVGSSSCSLLALLLASKKKYCVHVTDIDARVLQHIKFARKLGLDDQIGRKKLFIERQDATSLTYRGEMFDRATAISVLEHIPGEGDTKAIKEVSRVLKPGGVAVVTVPYNLSYRETFVRRNVYDRAYEGSPVFYQRHYDTVRLVERLIEPSGLVVKNIEYFGEDGLRFERFWESAPVIVKALVGWMRPVFSMIAIRRIGEDSLQKAMAAFLVLEKY